MQWPRVTGECSSKAPSGRAGKGPQVPATASAHTRRLPTPHLRHRLRYECGQAVGGVGWHLRGGLQPLVQRLHAQLANGRLQLLLLAPAPNGSTQRQMNGVDDNSYFSSSCGLGTGAAKAAECGLGTVMCGARGRRRFMCCLPVMHLLSSNEESSLTYRMVCSRALRGVFGGSSSGFGLG